jgi:glycosyltransferase involved in cell wall biosynthesis
VATRIAGYADLLEGRDLARLVDAGNAAGLAREIGSLLDDPRQAHALGVRAAATVWEYDWGAIANRLDGIYRGVMGPTAGPSGFRDQLRLNELPVET